MAEIASLSGSRHLYLELIEKKRDAIVAKSRANIWYTNANRILTHFQMITRETLKPGMKVLLNVKVDFHVQYGFSLSIVDIDPSFSLGEFERIKQQTIEQLDVDGLLEMNKMLELPMVIQNIAIVTSATAAGYQDFLNELQHNSYGYHFNTTLFPALVQGEKAPESLINAINEVEKSSQSFDALIIIRGGGSVIDLSCFDDFEFNYQLAQSTIPILTGIGHDRDQSVSDLVAHTSLKTPTAVAQFCVDQNGAFDGFLLNATNALTQIVQDEVGGRKTELDILIQRLTSTTQEKVMGTSHSLDQLTFRLESGGKRALKAEMLQCEARLSNVFKTANRMLKKESNQLDYSKRLLMEAHPDNVLRRGYAIISNQSDTDLIDKNDQLTIETLSQTIEATVTNTKQK